LKAGFDFGLLGFRVGGVGDFAAIGGRDTAGDVHAAPVGRRPSVAAEHAGGAVVALAGDAVELADDDGEPGHAGGADGGDHAGAGALDALTFGFGADHETGFVGQRDQRQVEQVGQGHQAHGLGAGGDVG